MSQISFLQDSDFWDNLNRVAGRVGNFVVVGRLVGHLAGRLAGRVAGQEVKQLQPPPPPQEFPLNCFEK
jgi:hypothetical protein